MQYRKDRDYGLTSDQLDFVLKQFHGRVGDILACVELPVDLGTIRCNLYGPTMGDDPVPNFSPYGNGWLRRDDKTQPVYPYGNGGSVELHLADQPWPTRVLYLNSRDSFKVMVLAEAAVQSDEPTLESVAGGPFRPWLPGSRAMPADQYEEASCFWSQHAIGILENRDMAARFERKVQRLGMLMRVEGVPVDA